VFKFHAIFQKPLNWNRCKLYKILDGLLMNYQKTIKLHEIRNTINLWIDEHIYKLFFLFLRFCSYFFKVHCQDCRVKNESAAGNSRQPTSEWKHHNKDKVICFSSNHRRRNSPRAYHAHAGQQTEAGNHPEGPSTAGQNCLEEEETNYVAELEGINLNDIDEDSEDEDLLDDF
jgi:hypothetical protein